MTSSIRTDKYSCQYVEYRFFECLYVRALCAPALVGGKVNLQSHRQHKVAGTDVHTVNA